MNEFKMIKNYFVSLQSKIRFMEKDKFNAIFPLKIQSLISLIMENKSLNFDDALDFLYQSKLYTVLSDEETKLWHLSSEKLFEILEIEKKTKKIVFPDFV